jgi:hypothetical protein
MAGVYAFECHKREKVLNILNQIISEGVYRFRQEKD